MLSVLAATYTTATRLDTEREPLRPFWRTCQFVRSAGASVRRILTQ